MPTYSYKCKDCLQTFEISHSMTEKQENCLECESSNIFRLLFAPKAVLYDGVDPTIEKRVAEFAQERCLTKAQEDLKKQKELLRNRELQQKEKE